jgi:hypothetical protein
MLTLALRLDFRTTATIYVSAVSYLYEALSYLYEALSYLYEALSPLYMCSPYIYCGPCVVTKRWGRCRRWRCNILFQGPRATASCVWSFS